MKFVIGKVAPEVAAERAAAERGDASAAAEALKRLRAEYPDAKCSLTFRSPWELLVATILSAINSLTFSAALSVKRISSSLISRTQTTR